MRFRAVAAVDLPAPIPVALVDDMVRSTLGLKTGTRTIVRYRRRRLAVWIGRLSDLPRQPVPMGLTTHDTIWLSKRARELLGIRGECDVILDAVSGRPLKVAPAFVDDLPAGNEVHVAAEVIEDLGTDQAIIYGNSGSVPVRLRPRVMSASGIRMTMLSRSLICLAPADMIEIGPMQKERLFLADRAGGRTRAARVIAFAIAPARMVIRSLAYSFETLLRGLLHAPVLSMRTVEAEIGDDTNRIVRIAPETLRVLGIQAGDEVILEWSGSRVIAVAHEKLRGSVPGVYHGVTCDDWGSDPASDAVPDHLVLGVAAEMRGELRIPRRTIVNVRRRVSSIFVQRLNELTVPIGGLLFAALALDKISGVTAAVGAVIVTVMAMAPARYRVAPRGRWP